MLRLIIFRKKNLDLLPGYYLSRVIYFLYSEKSVNRVFEPMLADIHHEYIHVLKENRKHKLWKLQLVRVLGNGSLLVAAFAQPIEVLLKKAKQIWKLG